MSASLERPDPVEKNGTEKSSEQGDSLANATLNEVRDFYAAADSSQALTDYSDINLTKPSSADKTVTGNTLDFTPVTSKGNSPLTSLQISIQNDRAKDLDIPDGIYNLRVDKDGRVRVSDHRLETPQTTIKPENNPLVMSGNDAIGLIARKAVGHEIWRQSRFRDYLDNGKAADAASVSLVLKSVGYSYADSANSNTLVKKLLANGWEMVGVSQAKEGDLMFGRKLGTPMNGDTRNMAIGLVADGNNVYHNGTGKWGKAARQDLFNPKEYGDQVFVLRPPPGPPIGTNGESNPFSDHFRRDIKPGNDSRPVAHSPIDYRVQTDRIPEGQQSSDYWRDHWKQYWSDYWSDYWRQYYSRNDNRQTTTTDRHRPQERYQPRDTRYEGPDGNSLEKSQRIYEMAKYGVGRKLWAQTDFVPYTQNGKLGSTASVSRVLQAAGFKYANAARTVTLAKQLLARGWQPISLNELRPGDIIYGGREENWQLSGGRADVAIVGQNGKILHNDRRSGVFSESQVQDVFTRQEFGDRIWALRPPDREVYVPPSQDRWAYEDYPRRDPKGFDKGYHRDGGDIVGDANAKIFQAAQQLNGRRLWGFLNRRTASNGCATAIAAVLYQAGFTYAKQTKHAGVKNLHDTLVSKGWQKLPFSQAQPGDVVVGIHSNAWGRGGGRSHIGIIGQGNTSYHASGGPLRRDTRSRWQNRYRVAMYVLRPPSRDTYSV